MNNWRDPVVPLLLPTFFGKGVFSPAPPDRGYFDPSHFFITVLFTSFYRFNLFDLYVPQTG